MGLLTWLSILGVATRTSSWRAVAQTTEAVHFRPESAASSRSMKVHAPCQYLYECGNFLGQLDNVTYTGSQKPQPNIGQFDSPVFDNSDLQGSPVARLRGSYLEDVVAKYATFVSAFEFFGTSSSTNEFLVVSLGFSTTSMSNGTGVALGGTGQWSDYRGAVTSEPYNSSWSSDDAVTTARPLVFRYTICR